MSLASAHGRYKQILQLFQARSWHAAREACDHLTRQHPQFAAGWYLASRSAIRLGSTPDALRCIDRALEADPANARFLLVRAQCLAAMGRLLDARAAATVAAAAAAAAGRGGAPDDPAFHDAIGTVHSHANDQERALAAYGRAVDLAPDNPRFLFNRATVHRFLGHLAEAEEDYDRVITLDPADYEAYRNRSDLRPQTAERNHVAQLEALLGRRIEDWRGEIPLRYALAKEYEDLGRYSESFRELQRGARVRREHLHYDVAADVATVDWIIQAFPTGPAGEVPAGCQDAPLFIVGLPRSGSTLVERILTSHSVLSSAGELNCFARAVVEGVRRSTGRDQCPRRELVERSATLDFQELGRDYIEKARAAAAASGRFIDKMPLNFLYCGLIRRALPRARIIHVTRSPMAACYAIYKTLFDEGYPYSYDLSELGRYYIAYRRLMAHWEATMPGDLFHLSYEELVRDPIGETRRLLEFCGLEWEDACAQFHRNPSPTATASASQVRRPIYATSVSQWRHYERQLEGLGRQLADAGIA